MSMLRNIWNNYVVPLYQRPARFQVAALCHRVVDDQTQVLLVTSRDTGRWILPKGWPIAGHDASGAAVVEAWEEAGVRPLQVGKQALGTYTYDKIMPGGAPVTCETSVFPMTVQELADSFPESDERTRRWVSLDQAAEMVDEPSLKELLRGLPHPVPM